MLTFEVLALVLVAAGAGVAVVGVLLLRRNVRPPSPWVEVGAVVVERTAYVRPSSVTFDYPVPGGWLRARRVEGMPVTTRQGKTAQPGDWFMVWVDPRNPGAVQLSVGASVSTVGGVLLVFVGLMPAIGGLWFVTNTLAPGR
ncbi:DUF3592 domain-containing protein [Cellulomonas sp. S1-8]|uniref:DUF3592 domain-containing protein n=1 Tax=Cellulomonas sp. S1-8 TaxID=2904790 RepID=UPI002243272B|nr:DUF3592 domain-containing protein [Cellulomonas sp. S1-8]UZN02140.1 DUF3592 domain-containing protein [Cellulomonas sp. S1-8]